ncbi:unnamed protein product [Closterium sp. NIES-54]
MASLRVLAFDHEGRPVQFDSWLDDLQLYLLSDSKDSVSIFDLASGAATTPPATSDSATRSQWLTRDAAARLAIRGHLPLAESAHFRQHSTAQALYGAVVARYSLRATAALGRQLLPYLFPELSFFATVEDQVSHLHTSDARYRATVPANAVAVGTARGTPHPPFFEGCSPSPLAPSYTSAAAADVPVAEDIGAASASVKRHTSKGKGGKGGGGGSGGGGGGNGSGGGGSSRGCGGSGGDNSSGTGGGSGGSGGGGGGSGGSGVSRGGGTGGGRTRPRCGGPGGGQRQQRRNYDAILSAMYALSASAKGGCYRCVPSYAGIEAAALGACESGTLPGLHLPLCSTNLVGTAALQDVMVTTTTPGGQRVSICTCTQKGRHLATFTHRPGSSPYRLATKPPQVAASAQVSASSLPTSLPPLPPLPAPPCLPCVEGRQRAAPHSSSFPPTSAPLQTLHMDVWGPARVSGQGRERYFLLVVDDYTRGGEFSSNLLRDFCHGEGILRSFTLPKSLQQNGIAERRIGLVMEVVCTSMIHAAAPHFLWPFAVRYAAHQLNLVPRVSPILPETSPTLRWTGEVGNSSVFRVWGSRAFVRDTSADKLSARAIPCVFLGFVPDTPGWQFDYPTLRRVLPSQDVTFYPLFPYRFAPPPPPPSSLLPHQGGGRLVSLEQTPA